MSLDLDKPIRTVKGHHPVNVLLRNAKLVGDHVSSLLSHEDERGIAHVHWESFTRNFYENVPETMYYRVRLSSDTLVFHGHTNFADLVRVGRSDKYHIGMIAIEDGKATVVEEHLIHKIPMRFNADRYPDHQGKTIHILATDVRQNDPWCVAGVDEHGSFWTYDCYGRCSTYNALQHLKRGDFTIAKSQLHHDNHHWEVAVCDNGKILVEEIKK
jgi:hypothetical protein